MTSRVIANDRRRAHDDPMTNTTTATPSSNTMAPTTTLDVMVDTHLRAYCEPDPATRADLLAAVWAPTGTLIDPPFDGEGLDAIAAMVDVVLTHYAGHTFRRTTAIDAHHAFGRYEWELVGPDGDVAVTGTDIVEIDDDGRLTRIIGFFGLLASAA
jgi:SnoaL-like domain